jgi:hypothetical protein
MKGKCHEKRSFFVSEKKILLEFKKNILSDTLKRLFFYKSIPCEKISSINLLHTAVSFFTVKNFKNLLASSNFLKETRGIRWPHQLNPKTATNYRFCNANRDIINSCLMSSISLLTQKYTSSNIFGSPQKKINK